jgi:hypothetical protein
MLRPYYVKVYQSNRGLWSRTNDGIVPALLLLLGSTAIGLAVPPITVIFGQPGLLVYVLALLAAGMLCLQQALVPTRQDNRRAWLGITAGMLCWSVVAGMAALGVPILPNLAGVLLLVMVSLIFTLLWKTSLPLGARFFGLAFLLHWGAQVFVSVLAWLAAFSPVFALGLRITGALAVFAALLVASWILAHSRGRVQRAGGALALWFLAGLALSVFQLVW